MDAIIETIIEAEVLEALRTCFDPEIPVNIYEMGLIYGTKVDPDGTVTVQMTLTSPSCMPGTTGGSGRPWATPRALTTASRASSARCSTPTPRASD